MPLASENDVYMVFIPLFHIYGIVAIVNIALYVGSTTVILPRFELEHYLSSIEKYKVRIMNCNSFIHLCSNVSEIQFFIVDVSSLSLCIFSSEALNVQ